MCGLIFIILTIPYNPSLLNFSLAKKGNFQFGNQGMENAGGQAGQGNAESEFELVVIVVVNVLRESGIAEKEITFPSVIS